jgi:hypothetical protein
MTTSTTTSTASTANKDHFFQTVTANEWGQITGLEPNAHYVLLRRPTKEMTKEKSQQFMADVTSFLQQQRELTEKQARDLNEKYGAPAKAKAMEVREKVEKRFDELTKEFESRVEKLEHELGERADRIFAKTKPQGANGGATTPDASGPSPSTESRAETPGEMPSGHHEEESSEGTTTATSTASNDAKGAGNMGNKKKGARREG